MTTEMGRAFEPGGRNIISGFEMLGNTFGPELLRVVRVLVIRGSSELWEDMT